MWPVNPSIFTEVDFAPGLKFSVIPTMLKAFPSMISLSPSAVMPSDEDHYFKDTSDDENTPSRTGVGEGPSENSLHL